MAIKLVVLKSGEDLIADVKEIQSENSNEVIGYYFYNPLLLKLVSVDPKPIEAVDSCLLYTSPSPRDRTRARMPSSA